MPTETVLITGAGGWLGSLLPATLAHLEPSTNFRFILADVVEPRRPQDIDQVITLKTDLTVDGQIEGLFHTEYGPPDTIYSMHGIMSLGSEQDFNLGMRVNFDSTRSLLENARNVKERTGRLPKFVLTSSVATYGGPLPDKVLPSSAATPESSYGTAKLMCEYLVTEYTRRGFVDGRSVKLPTVVIRPGPPSKATSAFVSGIVREPLSGKQAICPIGTNATDSVLAETPVWVASPSVTLANLAHARRVATTDLPSHNRSVALPGFAVSVREILDALCRVEGSDAILQHIKFEHDETCRRIVTSWPRDFDIDWAVKSLGFHADKGGIEGAIREYKKAHSG